VFIQIANLLSDEKRSADIFYYGKMLHIIYLYINIYHCKNSNMQIGQLWRRQMYRETCSIIFDLS